MPAEGDVAVGSHLLIPGQAVAVGIEAGDDITQSVTIDVIDEHLSGGIGEMKRVLDPNGVACERGGLLPPGILLDDVNPPITVKVAAAQAVGELLIIARGCDGMERPGRG